MKRAVAGAGPSLVAPLLVALLGVLLFAAPAAADEDLARRQFEAGAQAMQQGRLDDARRAFERSLEHAPRPATAYNLAVVLHAMGEPRNAERVLESLRAGEYGELTERGVQDVEALAIRVAGEVAELDIAHDGGAAATVRVDGELAESPLRLNPGSHVVTVTTADERFAEAHVELAPGEHRRVALELGEPPARAPELHESPWLWTGIGAALIAVAVTVGVAVAVQEQPQPITDDVWPTAITLRFDGP